MKKQCCVCLPQHMYSNTTIIYDKSLCVLKLIQIYTSRQRKFTGKDKDDDGGGKTQKVVYFCCIKNYDFCC